MGHRIASLGTLEADLKSCGRRWGRRFGSVAFMAPKISTEKLFRRLQKVVAAVDLPGVPAGTFGKVWFVSGVTWIRYHVAFDNGAEIANVDGAEITDRKVWLAAQAVRDQEALERERAERRENARAEALANLATGPAAH
ncbi:unannotated protein [freshwater metagenome]|uniref:Unannotated protein n=1 Tax=freshwater metagenome TaxID=449393 RepID=A0A6J7L6H5_9ZZZZ